MTHAYVDIDTYNIDRFLGVSPNDIVEEILSFCRDNHIALPSMIIDSGRGLYLKYLWSTQVNGKAGGRAIAVNRKLVEMFAQFGADPKCVDMSRILRVVGSVNTKNGRTCNIVWMAQATNGGSVMTYEFDSFANEVLPYTYEEVKEFRRKKGELISLNQTKSLKKVRSGVRGTEVCWFQFHWKVLMDLQKLKQLRYNGGYVRKSMRDIFGFLGAVQLAHVIPNDSDLYHEIRCWVSQNSLLSESYTQKELLRACSTLLARLKEKRAGKYQLYEGKKVSCVYTYTIKKMVELLKITSDEMSEMLVLIDAEEKKRRHIQRKTKKNREMGVLPREKYCQRSVDKAENVKRLRASGSSVSEIAKLLGISRSSIYGYLKD
jgi:hypothetical protein